jgi:hypothetical protein
MIFLISIRSDIPIASEFRSTQNSVYSEIWIDEKRTIGWLKKYWSSKCCFRRIMSDVGKRPLKFSQWSKSLQRELSVATANCHEGTTVCICANMDEAVLYGLQKC